MVWALDSDDFSGTFCNAGKYPLIKALKNALSGGRCVSPPIIYCHLYSSSFPYGRLSSTFTWGGCLTIRLRVGLSRSYTSLSDKPFSSNIISHTARPSSLRLSSHHFHLYSHRLSFFTVLLYSNDMSILLHQLLQPHFLNFL